jgi:hypothetical protein
MLLFLNLLPKHLAAMVIVNTLTLVTQDRVVTKLAALKQVVLMVAQLTEVLAVLMRVPNLLEDMVTVNTKMQVTQDLVAIK